jgi:hypothetical protein
MGGKPLMFSLTSSVMSSMSASKSPLMMAA